jgi:hypothetical protein
MSILYDFETEELPRLLNVTGLLPPPPPNTREDEMPRIDLSPIKQFDLKLCVAKEWYRFSGHYLVPDGVSVDFVKSEFDGLLPGHFKSPKAGDNPVGGSWWLRPETKIVPEGVNDLNQEEPSHYVRLLHPTSSQKAYSTSLPGAPEGLRLFSRSRLPSSPNFVLAGAPIRYGYHDLGTCVVQTVPGRRPFTTFDQSPVDAW